MTTSYDPIAEQYQRSKQQPWRTHIESFTLMELVGNPSGQSVLDVACGEGFYTRLLRRKGAARAAGVDISEGMVQLGLKQEAAHGLGIEYSVGDARDLAFEGEFDLAVAAYLLNYAPDRQELERMCRGVARALKPGGRFVTVNGNPGLNFSKAPSYRKYGFETSVVGEFREGAPITWTFHLADGSFSIENYHLDIAAHEQCLRAAGFKQIRWHGPRLSPEGRAEFGEQHWADFMNHPPAIFLECTK